MLSRPLFIERDDPIQRARQTAALTRVVLGVLGVLLILAKPQMVPVPTCGIIGFAIIVVTALLQLADLRVTWVQAEGRATPGRAPARTDAPRPSGHSR